MNFSALLDKTVIFSFDQSGFDRHKKGFDDNLETISLEGKRALVTGGTAGIGLAVTSFLTQHKAHVMATGRATLDMASWSDIRKFCKQECGPFDFVVLNAGSMPENYTTNAEGVELQVASQLVGHYLLIDLLRRENKLNKEARIVWVSSGGMYLRQLDLQSLFQTDKYDKVATYANVKRAQVTLVEELAKIPEWSEVEMFCMHPGWVNTPGLTASLPLFSKLTKRILRTPAAGADTILWLLLSNKKNERGGFYFDRKKVSAYVAKKFNPSQVERHKLLSMLNAYL